MEENQEVLRVERIDTKSRLAKIAEIGKPVIGDTALVQNKEFTQEDALKIGEFFEKTKPFVHANLWPSYWVHIELAGRYARILGEKLQDKGLSVNPFELEVLSMIHDIGRLVSPHRFYRANLVGDSLLKMLGVREDLRAEQVPEAKVFGRGGSIEKADELTVKQQVLLLADNLGRRFEDGNLIKFEQLSDLTAQQAQQYTGEVFASERFGKRRLIETSRKVVRIMGEIKQMWYEEYGINIDDIREEVSKTTKAG